MSKFTKTYEVEPNNAQKAAMTKCFKTISQYFLNEQKKDVEIVVKQFCPKRIIAQLLVNGLPYEYRLIGIKGGVKI